MSSDIVRVMNTKTGQTGTVPRRVFEHPILSGGNLVEVKTGTKSYSRDFYKPRTTAEFISEKPDKVASGNKTDDNNYEEAE